MLRFAYCLYVILIFTNSCSNSNPPIKNVQEAFAIIPKPHSIQILKGRFNLNKNTQVTGSKTLEVEGEYLCKFLSQSSKHTFNYSNNSNGDIILEIDTSINAQEGYNLNISNDKVVLKGKSKKGIFYGIQTLRQLLQSNNKSTEAKPSLYFPCTLINDQPQFNYRGMHLDVCRHFFSVDFVKKYLDIMALHKLNTFHWHLTEDQGWRIEILKYPKLTEVGAWRNGTIVGHYPGTDNDNKRYGGFYTQQEIKDIVDYAQQLHITIIPEIELPGHSSAAIAAYPFLSCFPQEASEVPNDMMSKGSKAAQSAGQAKIVQESWGVYKDVYCAGNEATFNFIEDVLTEVMELFPSKYIHIGGDECPKDYWKKSASCQAKIKELGIKDEHELQSYFIKRIEAFVNNNDKRIIGWDEILEGGLAPDATVMSWRGNKGGIAAAQENHQVIMSPNSHCYFDHYQSEDKENEPLAIGGFLPLEKVYNFNPIPDELEADKHHYILGGQANLWTEYIDSDEKAEYMLLPRMTALSEALWSSPEDRNYEEFKVRLNGFRDQYEYMGVNYAKHVFE